MEENEYDKAKLMIILTDQEMNLGSCDQDFIQFGRDILFVTTHLSRRYCGHHSPPSVTSHMGHRRFSLPPGSAANRYRVFFINCPKVRGDIVVTIPHPVSHLIWDT